jgi:nucleoside 2-deoxyribosyltransferase
VTIYFAFTVRGNRDALAAGRAMCDLLQRRGHTVLTTHLVGDDPDETESSLAERDVYARDMRWLESADLLIAEASGSSFGVGFEVGYVLGRSDRAAAFAKATAPQAQRVLLLFAAARRPVISRMITGISHPACTVREYTGVEDLLRIVEDYVRDA